MALKFLSKQLQKVYQELPQQPGFSAGPLEDDLFHWVASIMGPDESPYEGGQFDLRMDFPLDYPLKAPKIWFLTKVFHPNIDKDGKICIDFLTTEWKPSYSISHNIQKWLDIFQSWEIRCSNPCSMKPCRNEETCVPNRTASSFTCYQIGSGCKEAYLVTGQYGVPDHQITGTPAEDGNDKWQPYKARLHSSNHWDPASQENVYIQVQFNKTERVRAVVTQGCHSQCSAWIESYTVSYSYDCVTFTLILDENGTEKIFPGNTDSDTPIINYLDVEITAKCVAIFPRDLHGYVALRFDIIGCVYDQPL